MCDRHRTSCRLCNLEARDHKLMMRLYRAQIVATWFLLAVFAIKVIW